jgi:selenocysteine lyase/cysteine desulfurase
MASALASKSIHVWHGHNYAYEQARALGLPLNEGVLRIGFAHYNTIDDVTSILHEIQKAVIKTK